MLWWAVVCVHLKVPHPQQEKLTVLDRPDDRKALQLDDGVPLLRLRQRLGPAADEPVASLLAGCRLRLPLHQCVPQPSIDLCCVRQQHRLQPGVERLHQQRRC